MTEVQAQSQLVRSPQWALVRYVEHSAAVRASFGISVQLARVDDPETNGWVIRAKLPSGVRIRAFEHEGGWQVLARRGSSRRGITEHSSAFDEAALLVAIRAADAEHQRQYPYHAKSPARQPK